jgi:GNAT superfamily N-acetyltransferase
MTNQAMTQTKLQLDSATLEDVPALIALLNTLFSIEQDFTPNVDNQKKGLELLIQSPQSGLIKVLRDATGVAVGMVSVQLVISTAQGAPSAWVEDMVISEPYRAQGHGRALLQSALDWAIEKGATRAQLLVDLDNEPALGYYQHLGWQTSNMGMRRLMLK